MAQYRRALTVLPEVLSSIPSNRIVVHNHLQWGLMPSLGVSEESNGESIKKNKIKKNEGDWEVCWPESRMTTVYLRGDSTEIRPVE